MKKVELLNLKGEKVKDINLNEEIFGITPNKAVLNDAIILTMASLRQGTHKTKNRSEVSGGGRKPWRQKGTGRARQGSIRAVQWVGGGRYGTPVPRDYSKKQNRKERQLALKSALSYKLLDKELINPFTAFKDWLEEEVLDAEAISLAIKGINEFIEKDDKCRQKLEALETELKKVESGGSSLKTLFNVSFRIFSLSPEKSHSIILQSFLKIIPINTARNTIIPSCTI